MATTAPRTYGLTVKHLASIVLVGAVGVGVGLGIGAAVDGNAGSAAEWLSGTATAAAVSFAVYQWRRDGTERREREERLQAEQIAAWIVTDGGFQGAPFGYTSPIRIANPTALAVLDSVVWDGTEWSGDVWHCDVRAQHTLSVGYLPPHSTIEREMVLPSVVLESPWLGLAFTDASGRHWLRQDPTLTRISVPPSQYFPDETSRSSPRISTTSR